MEPNDFDFEEAPQSMPARSFRPHILVAIAVVSALLVGGATYAFAARGDKQQANDVVVTTRVTEAPTTTVEPTTTAVAPTTSAAPTATTAAPAPVGPSFIVAVSTLNRLVLIDPTTGKTTKVLKSWKTAEQGGTCEGPSSVALNPDRTIIYYAASVKRGDLCDSDIFAMTTDGTDLGTIVKTAQQPSVSPDGKQLAFARLGDVNQPVDLTMKLVTMNLATKTETVRRSFDASNWSGMLTTWSPDGRFIVMQPASCGCGDLPWMDMERLDLQSGAITKLRSYWGNENASGDNYWSHPMYLANGKLMVLSQQFHYLQEQKSTAKLIIIDDATGKQTSEVSSMNFATNYWDAAIDATGTNTLVLGDNTLSKVHNGEKSKGIAYGVTSVAW